MSINTPQPLVVSVAELLLKAIAYPHLPLAVYREIAAHLQQIEGVTVELLPQDAPFFDYAQSQIKALKITHSQELTETQQDQLKSILDYYAQIHGSYQLLDNY